MHIQSVVGRVCSINAGLPSPDSNLREDVRMRNTEEALERLFFFLLNCTC